MPVISHPTRVQPVPANTPRPTFLGIPTAGFGAFATVLISAATAALTFFFVTFLSIFGIMIYNSAGHHLTYAFSYRWIALPAAIAVLLCSLLLLGPNFVRAGSSAGRGGVRVRSSYIRRDCTRRRAVPATDQ